jgi:rhamnosyl/mannosyltransferase
VKVVHASKFYPPVAGGTLSEGPAREWEVTVVAANDASTTTAEQRAGVRIVRVGSCGVAVSVSLCPTLPWRLWREAADANCVVLHEPNPVAAAALWVHTPGRRLIIWHHSDVVRPWWAPATYGRFQRALYRRADCVIVSNPVLAERSALVRRAKRVAVIPHGVDLAKYRTLTAGQRVRVDEILRTTSGPRVLFVGRFVYYKGLHVLIDAMRRCPGTLILVGDGPFQRELQQQVAQLGLASRVVFAGPVSDDELPAYYHASDVFALPSVAESETYGLVQIEAMASGLPVVSTNLPTGVPWVNQDGVTGAIVAPGDAVALSDALTRILDDRPRARALGENGRARAEAVFSREHTVERFMQLIDTAVRAPESLDRLILET